LFIVHQGISPTTRDGRKPKERPQTQANVIKKGQPKTTASSGERDKKNRRYAHYPKKTNPPHPPKKKR